VFKNKNQFINPSQILDTLINLVTNREDNVDEEIDLNLSLCKTILEQFGGSLRVFNSFFNGTEIELRLSQTSNLDTGCQNFMQEYKKLKPFTP
jgi:K+-sensing histidine kinase KdpD